MWPRRGWRPELRAPRRTLRRSIIPAVTSRRSSPSSMRPNCGSAADPTRSSPKPIARTANAATPPTAPRPRPLSPRRLHRGRRHQCARRRRRRDRHGRCRRADDRGDTDAVAAVGVRGNHRPARRRGAAHPIADRGPPAARPHRARRQYAHATAGDAGSARTWCPAGGHRTQRFGQDHPADGHGRKPSEGRVFRRRCASVRHYRARQSAGCPRRRNRR